MNKIPLDKLPTSKTAQKMLHRVTPIYGNSYVIKLLYEVMGKEFDVARELFETFREQRFIDTVTWGIEFLEHKFSIVPDDSMSLEQRRARLRAKNYSRMPLNLEILSNHLYLKFNRRYEIDETQADGVLWFQTREGTGENFAQFRRYIRKIIPAHLEFYFRMIVDDLEENVDIEDRADFQIMLKYEDQIPYGGTNNQAYSYELIYPFEYRPERDFDIDEIRAGIEFNFEDRYEALIEYGVFDYGHNAIYGGFTALPLDSNLNLQIGLDLADTPKEIADRAGELVITHTFHYGENAVYGEFGYGEQVMTEDIAGGLELTREGAIEKWRRLM